ncbi:MAG: dienelactone hydrolase family protein [Balneolaceae bacterium]|nr:dienelactone hydrolase family protein [Balneolaceae bacterium]
MFKASSDNPFQGPHQKTGNVTAGENPEDAKAAMVMVHGRGASAESILTLANDLGDISGFHFAAPRASQSTWYPYSFLEPTERNEPGLSSGLQAIFDIIENLESGGIPKGKIILLGFSQGACLASEFVARHPARYGGVVALSGGLIGDSVDADNYSGSLDGTPYFVGCSDIDPHIPVERVHESADVFEKMKADVTKKIYPGMGHTVIADEIEEVNKIIDRVLSAP